MVVETNVVVSIPVSLYEEMVAHVIAGYPDETCGALGSKDGLVVKHYPTANAAEHPDDYSEISGEDRLRILFAIDEYDGEMIYYHSHPKSEARPSPRDIDVARVNGYLYLIFSHQYYPEPPYPRVFKITPDGTVTEGKVIVS